MKLLASVFLLLLFTNVAWAEGNCPAGMYPNAGGCAPIPPGPATNNQDLVDKLRNTGPNPNAPAVLPTVDTYIAVALHPEADDPWAIWNTQDQNVSTRVLNACEEVMKDKRCTIVGEGKNIAVAIGYKSNHLMDAASGKDPWAAKENLKKKCGSDCLVGAVFAAHPVIRTDWADADIKGYLPTKETVRLKSQNALNLQPLPK